MIAPNRREMPRGRMIRIDERKLRGDRRYPQRTLTEDSRRRGDSHNRQRITTADKTADGETEGNHNKGNKTAANLRQPQQDGVQPPQVDDSHERTVISAGRKVLYFVRA